MSTLKGKDDCTDTILDFVAGGVPGNPSGESAGNYNAVIGEVDASEDLSTYTIFFIYQLMDRLQSQHRPSTAVGRYQIIRSTLKGLTQALSVPNTTKFTPNLQDRMAVKLLVGRGYKSWWRGGMSDEEFAHGISCEWASLPDPENGGKSHYDGVGPNHASTNLASVFRMLVEARGKISIPHVNV